MAFYCSGNKPTRGKKNNRTGMIVGIVVPILVVGFVLFLIVLYIRRKSVNEDEEGKSISI